jgi:hypothetical protein
LQQAPERFPLIERVFAHAGFQGPKMAMTVAAAGRWTMEIVRRCDLHRFVAPPKRWIFERSFGWTSGNRYLTYVSSGTEEPSPPSCGSP